MHFGEARHGPGGALPQRIFSDDRVVSVGRIFHPGQDAASPDRGRVEGIAQFRCGAGAFFSGVEDDEPGIDPLGEEQRTAVFGPPDPLSVGCGAARDESCPGAPPLASRSGIDRNEP